jgi:hypothetical protein
MNDQTKFWWRLPLWLGVVMAVTMMVTACSSAVSQKQSKADESASSTPTRENTPSPLGPSACLTTSSSGGSGAWKAVEPRTLCGQVMDTSAQGLEIDQEALKTTELIFSPLVETTNIGTYTSGYSASYELPPGLGVTRFVNIEALNGHFNAAASVQMMTTFPITPSEVFHTLPPGPHGGSLQCAVEGSFSSECIFGTATTITEIEIEDTSEELVGVHAGATAVEIRNAVEVRS